MLRQVENFCLVWTIVFTRFFTIWCASPNIVPLLASISRRSSVSVAATGFVVVLDGVFGLLRTVPVLPGVVHSVIVLRFLGLLLDGTILVA